MRFGRTADPQTSQPRSKRRPRRLALLLLLIVPLIGGSFAAPSTHVAGDELSDAVARQKALERQIKLQKAQIAELNALQGELKTEIGNTADELAGVTADLSAVKARVAKMVSRINVVKAKYAALVAELKVLDAQVVDVIAKESAKRGDLQKRKDMLAERLRNAYDTDRTSLLETILSGGSFTDLLTEVSYYLDAGEQDRALAQQIIKDQETLSALHQTVVDTQVQTNMVRVATANQKVELDRQLKALKKTQAQLKVLEHRVAQQLAAQRAAYARAAHNRAALAAAVAHAARAQRALTAKIDRIVREQAAHGRIPSQYNGTLVWPMPGTVSQEFGCTGFSWEPPLGDCAHFHQGIDIVAPYGTAIRSSGPGTVAYVGWNWADGADPAWIVIIAHASNLETWYAHMQPRYPVTQGQAVSAGQIIGYEGSTGHSTGAHLHWAVRLNGEFVNPRLFL